MLPIRFGEVDQRVGDGDRLEADVREMPLPGRAARAEGVAEGADVEAIDDELAEAAFGQMGDDFGLCRGGETEQDGGGEKREESGVHGGGFG